MVPTWIVAPLSIIVLANTAYAQDVISAEDRLKWVVNSTVGPASLAGGTISAGFGTLLNTPSEYGTHWDGFGKRYGMRLTGVASSNALEAGPEPPGERIRVTHELPAARSGTASDMSSR